LSRRDRPRRRSGRAICPTFIRQRSGLQPVDADATSCENPSRTVNIPAEPRPCSESSAHPDCLSRC
jgi:hypothetical protein